MDCFISAHLKLVMKEYSSTLYVKDKEEKMKVSKDYNPPDVEPRWQKQWEELDIYRFRRDDLKAPTYVIDTPPPYSS